MAEFIGAPEHRANYPKICAACRDCAAACDAEVGTD
jgi:hypothetical protein